MRENTSGKYNAEKNEQEVRETRSRKKFAFPRLESVYFTPLWYGKSRYRMHHRCTMSFGWNQLGKKLLTWTWKIVIDSSSICTRTANIFPLFFGVVGGVFELEIPLPSTPAGVDWAWASLLLNDDPEKLVSILRVKSTL